MLENLPYLFQDFLHSVKTVDDGVIFITHDFSTTGAPINLLKLCHEYKLKYGDNFIIVSLSQGELLSEFESIGPSFCLDVDFSDICNPLEISAFFCGLYSKGYKRAFINTIISAILEPMLRNAKIHSIFLIHELPAIIKTLGLEAVQKNLVNLSVPLVFASTFVKDEFANGVCLHKSGAYIIPQPIRKEMLYDGSKQQARLRMFDKINRPYLETRKIILGSGETQSNKGTDYFIEVLSMLDRVDKAEDFEFIWIGKKTPELKKMCDDCHLSMTARSHLHFIGYIRDPAFVFKAADMFLMTSRHDSYPSAALEALSNETPVILFSGTSGIEEIIDGSNGIIIPKFNIQAMADAILNYEQKESHELFSKPNNSYSKYLDSLMSIFEKYDEYTNFF